MRKSFLTISTAAQAPHPGQTTVHKRVPTPSGAHKPLPPPPNHWQRLKRYEEEAFKAAGEVKKFKARGAWEAREEEKKTPEKADGTVGRRHPSCLESTWPL